MFKIKWLTKKILPLSFFVFSLNLQLSASDSKEERVKAKLNAMGDIWNSVSRGGLPKASSLAAAVKMASELRSAGIDSDEEELDTDSEDFNAGKFSLLLYRNVKSVFDEQQLDMEAVRSLLLEWNKGEAVDLNVLIRQTTAKILSNLHEKLSVALIPIAKKQELSPFIKNDFLTNLFLSLDEELQEPIRMRLALMILEAHKQFELGAERLEATLEQNEFYQEILAKTEENLGRWLVKSLSKLGFKKGLGFVLPGADVALTVAERTQALVPKRAIDIREGDSAAVVVIAATVGQQKNKELQTFHKYNPLGHANHWLDRLLVPPARCVGGCFRKVAQKFCLKPVVKAYVAQTTLDLLQRIAVADINFGTNLREVLAETCERIDAETAELRRVFLEKKAVAEEAEEIRIKERKDEIKAELQRLELDKKEIEKRYDKKREESLLQKVTELTTKISDHKASIVSGWTTVSPFQNEKNEELKSSIFKINQETLDSIAEARSDLSAAEAADKRSSLTKTFADTPELTTLRAAFKAKEKELKAQEAAAISAVKKEHKEAASKEKDSIRAEISSLEESKKIQEKALLVLQEGHKQTLADIYKKEARLKANLASFKKSFAKKARNLTYGAANLAMEFGGSYLGQTAGSKSGKALAEKFYGKAGKEQGLQTLALETSRLEQRKGRSFLASCQRNPKKAMAAVAITGVAAVASVPLAIGVGAASTCTLTGLCHATVMGTASSVTTKAAYAVAIPVTLKAGNRAVSCLVGCYKKEKSE